MGNARYVRRSNSATPRTAVTRYWIGGGSDQNALMFCVVES